MALRALLLDFDGTVVDSMELIYQCLDATARAVLGRPFPRRQWEDRAGLPLADLFRTQGDDAVERLEELVTSYRARQEGAVDRVAAFPGMSDTLRQLRERDVRLAIVTTKMQAIARRHLAAAGLAELFEVVIGFDDCSRPKPDAEPFRRALEALGVSAAEAVGVGDSPFDILGARAAGLYAVGVLWNPVGQQHMLAAQPDRTIAQPRELLALDGWETGSGIHR